MSNRNDNSNNNNNSDNSIITQAIHDKTPFQLDSSMYGSSPFLNSADFVLSPGRCHIMKKCRTDSSVFSRRNISSVATLPKTDAISNWSEDLFLYMARFFISETGHVDGMTLLNMSLVSQHWYSMLNSPSLWSIPTPFIDAAMSNPAGSLIGFRKLQEVNHFRKDISHCQNSNQKYPSFRILNPTCSEALCQISNTHDLLGGKPFYDAPPTLRSSILFPLRVYQTVDKSKLIVFYEDCEQSLQSWVQSHLHRDSRKESPPPETRQLSDLPLPLGQLQEWMRQLITALTILQNHCLLPNSELWAIPENIFVDHNSTRLRIMIPDVISNKDLVGKQGHLRKWNIQPSLFSLGLIMALIARSSHKSEPFPPNEEKYLDWFKQQYPGLPDSGRTFLGSLVQFRSDDQIMCPPTNLTANQAMSHPFLAVPFQEPHVHEFSASLMKRKLSMEPSILPDRPHIGATEWATLVDWTIEVCVVFDINSLVAFRAMDYLDKVISRSATPIPPNRYQSLTAACLLIATKVTGFEKLTAMDLVICADNTFHVDDIILFEQFTLEILQWHLTMPTSLEFTIAITEFSSCSVQKHSIHWCVAVAALQTAMYRLYPASLIGAATSLVACYCLCEPLRISILEQEMNYSIHELQLAVSTLCSGVESITRISDLKAIERSFSVSNYGGRPVPGSLDLLQYTS
jgi:Cyclin, N-terminal domain